MVVQGQRETQWNMRMCIVKKKKKKKIAHTDTKPFSARGNDGSRYRRMYTHMHTDISVLPHKPVLVLQMCE